MDKPDEGGTVVPSDDTALDAKKCMGRYKHAWQWIWRDGQMTNEVRCSTCGATELRERSQA